MRIRFVAAVAALAVTACGGQRVMSSAGVLERDAVRDGIQARMDSAVAFARRGDRASRLALLTADWTATRADGEPWDRTDLERADAISALDATTLPESTSYRIDSLVVDGDTAVLVASVRTMARIADSTGVLRLLETGTTQRERWVFTDRGWLQSTMDELAPLPPSVDGEPQPVDTAGFGFSRVIWEHGVARAREVFDESRRRDTATPPFAEHVLTATAHKLARRGRIADAIEVHRMVALAYPGSIDARAALLRAQGDTAGVERAYREAIATRDDSTELRVRLGNFFLETRRYDRAFAEFEAVLRSAPQRRDALYALGATAAASGERLERGKEALDQLLRLPIADPRLGSRAHLRLGEIDERLGNAVLALRAYRRALILDPSSTAAREGLQRLQ